MTQHEIAGRPRQGADPEPKHDHPTAARTGTGNRRLTRRPAKKKTPSAARAGRGSEGGAPEPVSAGRRAQELCSECPCFASWDVAGVLFCVEHCPRPLPARTPVRRILLRCACGAEATVSPPGYADPIVCVACAGRAFPGICDGCGWPLERCASGPPQTKCCPDCRHLGETKPSPSDAQSGGGPRGERKKNGAEGALTGASHDEPRERRDALPVPGRRRTASDRTLRLFGPEWFERRPNPRPYAERPIPAWQRPERFEDDWRADLLAELEAEFGPRHPGSEFGPGELSFGALALDDSSSSYLDVVPEATEREIAAELGITRRKALEEVHAAQRAFRAAWRREGRP